MDLDSRLSTLNEQMNMLGRDAKIAIDKVAADAEVTKADILKESEFRKVEMTQWSDGFKDQSGPPGLGGGKGRGGGTDKNIDKKEIAVWKIPDDVDKTGFRHWVKAVDMQLELVHGMEFASFVLNHIRRAKVAIDVDVLSACVVAANLDISKAQMEMKVESGEDIDHPQDYPFQKSTTFLYAYLVSKLNTNLLDKTVGIEHRNGFELYRQICKIVDAVPEDAQFHMNKYMIGLAKTFGPKVTDLKSMYGFRLLLKKRMAEYKKVLGEDFEPDQAMHILWNVLDNRSKEIAMNAELNKKSYKDLHEHIDLRDKIQFGHFN